jgi:hypothetical protein
MYTCLKHIREILCDNEVPEVIVSFQGSATPQGSKDMALYKNSPSLKRIFGNILPSLTP